MKGTAAFAAAAGLLFLGIQILHLPDVKYGGEYYFLDPDSFTWLSRAERVLEGSGIHIHEHPEDNFPRGYTPHWTQPFHWVLALFALAFRPFASGREALELAGVWICPIFGALTIGLLAAWAFRRWPWFVAAITALVFLVNPFEQWTFSLGRPDHQCLLIFLLMAGLLILLDLKADAPRRRAWLLASAALISAAVWITVEGLSVWALCLGALGLRAALAKGEDRNRCLTEALLFSAASAGFTFLFALVERQGRVFEIVTDSISTGQAAIMGVSAAGLLLTRLLSGKVPRFNKPAWFLAVLAPPFLLAVAASLWLWRVHENAQDPTHPGAAARWFSNNLEFLPAVFMVNGEIALKRLHGALGFTLYALPLLLYGLHRTRLLGPAGKWILGAGIVLASVLTLWQMRWRDLHSLLIAPVLALGVYECLLRFTPLGKTAGSAGGWRRPAPALAGLGAAALLVLPWITGTWQSLEPGRKPRADYRALRRICEWIRKNDPLQTPIDVLSSSSEPVTVMAVWDQGPMVHYWTGRPVVAGPYHRNMAGIIDTMLAYTARNESAFVAIAEERRVRYVIRPPLGDYLYDLYTFEWIAGVRDPLLYIRSEQITADGQGTARGYDLSPGKTVAVLGGTLRKRLEDNQWNGWSCLRPVAIPGLEKILPDATLFPYLYRYD